MKIRHIIEGGLVAVGIAGAALGVKAYIEQQEVNKLLADNQSRLSVLIEAGTKVDRVTILQLCMTQQASGFIDPTLDCKYLADIVINGARGQVTPIHPLAPVATPHFEQVD